MISDILFGLGFMLTSSSAALAYKIASGSPALRPQNPLLLNFATIVSNVTALGAVVGGFWIFNWWWIAIALAIVMVPSAITVAYTSRTGAAPGLTAVYALIGSLLIAMSILF
ncbi:MAG: hypothetical protein ACOYO0_03270 [Sandarakinorhabdus sp.]